MSLWVLEPKDPLVFRDGRPFNPVPGARAVSLRFPLPSTIAGAVRTREGQNAEGRFEEDKIPYVRRLGIRGPLLVQVNLATGEIERFLVPPPKDALILEDASAGKTRRIKALVPVETEVKVRTNLPDALSLIGMSVPDFAKPLSTPPAFWYWEFFEKWLFRSQDTTVALSELGASGPVPESRFHVGLDPTTKAAYEGALFQTSGLDFTSRCSEPDGSQRFTKFGLAVDTEAPNLRDGLGFLGGERRFVAWRKSQRALPPCPALIKSSVVEHRHCRVVLLTPAYFREGSHPTWLLEHRAGVHVKLRAVAVGRPQIASGWDMARPGPRPARRLAGAGTVFFLELSGNQHAIANWVERTWMSCISDEEQDRLDGFGLAVIGVWDGKLRRMEV